MKNTPLILSIAAVAIAVGALVFSLVGKKCDKPETVASPDSTAVAGDIVYIQIDTLVQGYDMFHDRGGDLEAKKQSYENSLNKKGLKLESDMKAFDNQLNKGLLTRSAAEKQQQELLQRQQNLQQEMAQKQNELMEEEQVLLNNVMYAIQTYLETYNQTHHFSLILTTSKANPTVIAGSPALDITQEILDGLNAEYAKTRTK